MSVASIITENVVVPSWKKVALSTEAMKSERISKQIRHNTFLVHLPMLLKLRSHEIYLYSLDCDVNYIVHSNNTGP